MLHIGQSTQSVSKNQSEIKCRLCLHHMCTPFHTVNGENIARFCVIAAKTKPNHEQSGVLFSIPYVSRQQSVRFDRKKGRRENSILKTMRLRPFRHDHRRRHLFSFSPPASASSHPSYPNDANKIRINITHLVAAGRKHVSPRFLKGQVATDGTAGIPWRVGNIVAGRDCGSNSGGARRMGGVEPCVRLRSRFGPRPDYLNLGGTAVAR